MRIWCTLVFSQSNSLDRNFKKHLGFGLMSKRKASTYNLDITILKSFFVFIMHNSFFFCLYNAPSKIDRVNFDFKYLKLALQNGKIFVNFAWVLKLILSTSLSKMNLLQLPHLYQLRNQSSKSRFFGLRLSPTVTLPLKNWNVLVWLFRNAPVSFLLFSWYGCCVSSLI